MERHLYLSGPAYYVPPERVSAEEIVLRDRKRLERLKAEFRFSKAFMSFDGFGIESIPAAGDRSAVEMASKAVDEALTISGTNPEDIDLIIDFSTVPSHDGPVGTAIQQVFRARRARCLGAGYCGCAAFHIALWICRAILEAHPGMHTALLVAADKTPPRSRMCFPLSILGDGASAVVVSDSGLFSIEAVSFCCMGELRDVIGLPTLADEPIPVDIASFENRLLPIYFKAMRDVIDNVLEEAGQTSFETGRIIYSNTSDLDRGGFLRSMGFSEAMLVNGYWRTLGHIFASDMVINLCRCLDVSDVQPGNEFLLAGSGAGFYWGATLLRSV